jgi:hypothetical protein
MTTKNADVLDPEESLSDATIALRRPDTPVTLSQLAALKGGAIDVINARVQILETLHRASIRATSPEDWLLFKSPEEQGGQVTGYLQDCGGDRVRDLWGIEIFDVSDPEKVESNDPGVFHYLIRGSGTCKLTGQTIENVEGGRASTDDFCKGKSGLDLVLAVRKAARANLDGGLTRALAGMQSVPLDELKAAWEGTAKKVENCRRGRGFGTRDERVGGASAKAPDVDPPVCPTCNVKGVYRPAKDNRRAFYGCPTYSKHPAVKFIIDAEKWEAEQRAKQQPMDMRAHAGDGDSAAREAGAKPPAKVDKDLSADDVFGQQPRRGREPGQEG